MFTPPRRDLPSMFETDDPIIDWDTEKSKALWSGVVIQAIKDAWCVDDSCGSGRSNIRELYRDSAHKWFMRTSTEPSSFFWVCEQLKLDADKLRHAVLGRKSKVRIVDKSGHRFSQLFTLEMACRRKATSTAPRTPGQHTLSSA